MGLIEDSVAHCEEDTSEVEDQGSSEAVDREKASWQDEHDQKLFPDCVES